MKMDSFDQLQVFDEKFRKKLVYEVKSYNEKTKSWETRYELTYIGIKQLIVEMSQKGQSMEILMSKVERVKIDNTPMNDVWQADFKIRNQQTKHETYGVSEASVFPWVNNPIIDKDTGKKIWDSEQNKYKTKWEQQYDKFARAAAVSKATRNAQRPQLPEMAIQLFVEKALEEKGTVEKIDTTNEGFCNCEGGPKTKADGKCNDCNKFSELWWNKNARE